MAFRDNLGPSAAADGGRPVESLAIEASRLGVKMLGAGGAFLSGGAVPKVGASEWWEQNGYASGALTNLASYYYLRVNLWAPFPRGLLSVQITPVDLDARFWLSSNLGGFTKAGFTIGCSANPNPMYVSWRAVGC